MQPARVFVVDDSVVVRRLVTEALSTDDALQVTDTAPNGRLALAKLPRANPDVVVLDVEMPEMDGLETLIALRKTHPNLPVIMFSTLTEHGAHVTVEALARGASDYVHKPGASNYNETVERVRREMVPKIKALCGMESGPSPAPVAAPTTPPRAAPRKTPRRAPRRAERIDLVAIGVSTGGPQALAKLLPALPGDFPVPIVIVQHMPPAFTKYLADRLDPACALTVREGVQDAPLVPGTVHIAPGGQHMVVEGRRGHATVGLNEEAPECFSRPSVDVLFRSVAAVYGPHALALVLTGMGKDGLVGSGLVGDQGGLVLAQDQASSVVWGMAGAVTEAGLADRVLPLDHIAGTLIREVQRKRTVAS